MTSYFVPGDANLIVYYRLDEDLLEFKYYDYGADALELQMSLFWSMEAQIDFNPITLTFCDPGTYLQFNQLTFMYQCLACDNECLECNGSTDYDCTKCSDAYLLVEADKYCKLI